MENQGGRSVIHKAWSPPQGMKEARLAAQALWMRMSCMRNRVGTFKKCLILWCGAGARAWFAVLQDADGRRARLLSGCEEFGAKHVVPCDYFMFCSVGSVAYFSCGMRMPSAVWKSIDGIHGMALMAPMLPSAHRADGNPECNRKTFDRSFNGPMV